jgi:hypothetical protein
VAIDSDFPLHWLSWLERSFVRSVYLFYIVQDNSGQMLDEDGTRGAIAPEIMDLTGRHSGIWREPWLQKPILSGVLDWSISF